MILRRVYRGIIPISYYRLCGMWYIAFRECHKSEITKSRGKKKPGGLSRGSFTIWVTHFVFLDVGEWQGA